MAIFSHAAALVLPATLSRPGPTSLLVLCALWEAATWSSWLLARRHATGGPASLFRASLPALVLGRLADALLLLSCGLLCWSLGGSWSTVGRGYIPDFAPPRDPAAAGQPAASERGPTLAFDSIQAQLHLADEDGRQPGPVRTALRNKLFWGFRLDGVLALAFALAALCKAALGLWLLRVGLRGAGRWRLLGLVPLGLALHVDTHLAALWWG